jgi:hypothetical protein
MAETHGSGRAGSVGSCGDASARAESVGSGHVYALGSRERARALSRAEMARGADPLGREHAGGRARGLGPAREHGSVDMMARELVWVMNQ